MSDPRESIQSDSGEKTKLDQDETTSKLGETTDLDVGETTDSNSGSGSISDWALVDDDGHLQDYETESTSSSVEVMEEEDDEDEPITPMAGNSPQANVVSPLYVLRLSSHEVSDTDEEVTSTSLSDSKSFDVLTSDLISGTTSQDSGEITSVDMTQQPEDTEVETPVRASMPVTPEELESLTRALDDVKNNLLQSQSVDCSLSSFEMFGEGAIQEAGKLVPVETDEMEAIKKSKGDYYDTDKHLIDQVKSLEEGLDQPETIGPLALVPGSDNDGTVAVVQEPVVESVWQQQIENVYRMIIENVRGLRQDDGRWYLGGYILLLSVIVCMTGCIFYCSINPVFVPKVPEVPGHDQCIKGQSSAYCDVIETRKDLEAVKEANADLLNKLLESEKNAEISNQEKSKLKEDMRLLEESVKDILGELGKCNKEKKETEEELDRKQREEDDLDLFDEEQRSTTDESARRNARRGSSQSENQSEDQSSERENSQNRNGKKEQEKKKRRKDSKDRKVRDEDGDESSTFEEGSSESDEFDSQWVNNIFELMNKTKNQIQDTWDEVRNISDNLWQKHSPSIEKLQKKFIKKFKHISNRFTEKVWKKTRKWFGRKSKPADKDDSDKESRATKDRTTRTKRRPHTKEDTHWSTKTSESNEVKTMCDSRLMELSRKIKILNVNKFEALPERQRWDLAITVKSVLRALIHDPHVKEDAVQSEWVRCQSDWWGGGDAEKVGDGCLECLSCWQVKWAKGDAKKCRKIKQEVGNVLDNRCPVGPFYGGDDDESDIGKKVLRDGDYSYRSFDADHDSYDDVHDDDDANTLFNEGYINDDDDDDYEDYDDKWYLGRAEERQYQREEPDDWYFRKAKDLDRPGEYPSRQAGPEEDPLKV